MRPVAVVEFCRRYFTNVCAKSKAFIRRFIMSDRVALRGIVAVCVEPFSNECRRFVPTVHVIQTYYM